MHLVGSGDAAEVSDWLERSHLLWAWGESTTLGDRSFTVAAFWLVAWLSG